MKKCPELGVKGITVGWLKHALNRTNQFKKIQWNIAIKDPCFLDATEDKLVNSHRNGASRPIRPRRNKVTKIST